MAALVEWANDDDLRVKVHLLNGPGGVGKTRLAADFAEDRFSKKWSAGFLPRDVSAATVLDGTGAGVLLIVDYPEQRTELVKGIIKSVSNDEQYDRQIRILLVSREDQAAWERVSNYGLKRFSMTSLDSSGSLPVEEALRVVEEAVDILADEGNLPLPDTAAAADWLAEHPLNRRPLYALAGAVHAMLAPGNAFMLSGAALLKDLTKIERSRVRSFSKRDFGDAESLEFLLALGVLSGDGLSKETLYALGGLGVVPGRAGAHLLQAIKKTPFWIAPIGEEQDGHLQRLAPDKLAVAFLDAVLLEDPVRELPAWLAPPALQAESFGDILARLCFDLREIDGAHSRFLEQTAIKMLENQPDLIGTFEGLAWKEATPFSAGFVAAVIERLLENADDPAQCAVLAGNLASRLSDLGQREEALAVAEEAVGIYRDLAAARPEAFLPNLAAALNTLAITLIYLARREEAVAAAWESVRLRRDLAAARPEAFLPHLAASLNNLVNMLSELGRREEAVAMAEEAVKIYRDLAVARPEAFLPHLAASLNNLANILSDLGRREEALAVADKAVGLRRDLAAAQPEVFLTDLAASLNNLAIRLSDLKRHEEALAVADEAVGLDLALATARPEAFLPDLALSLNTLAARLSGLGRREEALAVAEEAVGLRRDLAVARPEAFLPDLALSLNNLANMLSDLGRREEALAAAKEAVSTLRPLFLSEPFAFERMMRVIRAGAIAESW